MAQRPFTAVPATRSSKRALRVKQNILIAAVLIGFFMGPLAMFMASRASSNIPSVPTPLPTPAIAFSEIVARDYVAGRATSMPVAKGVPQDLGFTSSEPAPLKGGVVVFDRVSYSSIGASELTLVRFRVVTPDQKVMNLTVPVTTDARNRLVLAALPSLTPALFAATEELPQPAPNRDTYPDLVETIPKPVTEIAAAWADAYAANNSQQLRVIVGGGASAPQEGNYFGLGGFTVSRAPTVQWAVLRPGDLAFMRVSFQLSEVAESDDPAVGEAPASVKGFTPSVELDLLVADWSTNSPRVVAWGAPGLGPMLEPYENNSIYL